MNRPRSEIHAAILEYFEGASFPVLFAGAGVSAQAGIPTWGQFINEVAEQIGQIAPEYRLPVHTVKDYVVQQHLQPAADSLWAIPISPAERARSIKTVLAKYDASKIACVAKLPFRSAVTTNYDRVLLQAIADARGTVPLDLHYPDPAIAQVPYSTEFCVTRIHGRVENPEEIVFTTSSYAKALGNTQYQEVLGHVFTKCQVMFVGFSFSDPAIAHVLDAVSRSAGTYSAGKHLALCPEDGIASALTTRLRSMGVKVVTYKDRDSLWQEICEAQTALAKDNEYPQETPPRRPLTEYVATLYSRLVTHGSGDTLSTMVTEAIVSRSLEQAIDGLTIEGLRTRVSALLGLPDDKCFSLVVHSVESLASEGRIQKDGDRFVWSGEKTHLLEESLYQLVNGVCDRIKVREGVEPTQQIRTFTFLVLNEILIQRGWDLGAAFAMRRHPSELDIQRYLHLVRGDSHNFSGRVLEAIGRSIGHLLQHPDDPESDILCNLGRASYGVELFVNSPRDVLHFQDAFPSTLILDANVLLPILVDGHGLTRAYRRSLDKLRESSARLGRRFKIATHISYLNEVVSHRRIALERMETLGNHWRDSIDVEIALRGPENINVFIASFATAFEQNPQLSFREYLRIEAPYNNEEQLEAFLGRHRIEVSRTPSTGPVAAMYPQVLLALERAYASMSGISFKTGLLLSHDAAVVSMMSAMDSAGDRPIFVTSDRNLGEALGKTQFWPLRELMISHNGLNQLAEILSLGGRGDAGLSRLIWGAQLSSQGDKIRNHLIDMALRRRTDAMQLGLGALIDKCVDEFEAETTRKKLSLDTDDTTSRAEYLRIYGDYTRNFWEKANKKLGESD